MTTDVLFLDIDSERVVIDVPPYGTPILVIPTGSQAYGLTRPESDVDFLGIYLAPLNDVLSFGVQQEVHLINNGDVDVTWWELSKSINFFIRGNFNALPFLAATSQDVLFATVPGMLMIKAAESFVSKEMLYRMDKYCITETFKFLKGERMKNEDVRKSLAIIFRQQSIIENSVASNSIVIKLTKNQRDGYFTIRKAPKSDWFGIAETLNLDSVDLLDKIDKSTFPDKCDTETLKALMSSVRLSEVRTVEG